MYGSLVGRLTAALALIWLLAAPVPAAADNCSYASIGDGGGNAAVATTGDGHCQAGPAPEPTPRPEPPPPPPPPPPLPLPPAPEPEPAPPPPPPPPSARPTPPPPRPVALPDYRRPPRKVPQRGPSLVTLTLLITAPAVFAVAVLRPRSR
ncbi:hypothetical protein [Streptomyces sp. NPDC005498]|uniref:hypothetical protein n=1 Tax=Streptomyces sp. NPDC005498 TaxID=3364717 RepID=UPI0036BA7A8E